ncbi:MAG TPA: hypothetical protein VGL74_09760 [Terriglobales bacterium]|jgi:type III secretory pathway component EscS
MPSENPHRGITMHQLPVAGDFPGLVFAVGSALIFLFAIPALWYVLVAAVVIGLVIAALLQVVHQRHPNETARLSLKI